MAGKSSIFPDMDIARELVFPTEKGEVAFREIADEKGRTYFEYQALDTFRRGSCSRSGMTLEQYAEKMLRDGGY